MSSYSEIEAYLESAPDDPGPYRRLDLVHSNGYVIQSVDFGAPTIREDVGNKPDAHGTFDHTYLYGASVVQVVVAIARELVAVPTTDQALRDGLARWVNPVRRSLLVWRAKGENDWRQTYIRGSNLGRQLAVARSEFGEVVLSFKIPKGISESYIQHTKRVDFSGSELGRDYTAVARPYDRTYPTSPVMGSSPVLNDGTAEAYPVIRIYGPCTDFGVENLVYGRVLKFRSTFSLLTDQWIEINTEEATVYMFGDPADSRYNQIDTSVNEWWSLAEGENYIRGLAASYTAPQAHVDVFWRDAYL